MLELHIKHVGFGVSKRGREVKLDSYQNLDRLWVRKSIIEARELGGQDEGHLARPAE